MKSAQVAAAALLGLLLSTAMADGLEVRGKVDSVTVYRGQALVTRRIEIPAGAGLREIVVTELPETVVPGSIYAESADGVEIRSVRYRVRPESADTRDDVRKLDESIVAANDKLVAATKQRELIAEHRAYLAKLEQFVAPTASVELSKGVLNAETLTALSAFVRSERERMAEQELQLTIRERSVRAELDLAQRARQTLAGAVARTAREAVVFANFQPNAGASFRLRYLVGNADWTPSYSARTNGDRKQVTMEYIAAINQMSGEDWSDVQMTLSTATPSLVAKAPELAALNVTLASVQKIAGKADAGQVETRARKEELWKQLRTADAQRASNTYTGNEQILNIQDQAGFIVAGDSHGQAVATNFDDMLNRLGCDLQLIDIAESGRVAKRLDREGAPEQEGVSVTYRLPTRTTLPSRSDQQLVQIAALALPAEFYRVATPVLTNYVYEQATVENNSAMVLLAGPVASYANGEFVGHGDIRTIAAGQKFTVGLGIDSSMRVARELVSREETTQGGNRVVEFTYRITMENFSGAAGEIRLLDRLPVGKDSEIRVTMLGEDALSADAEYQKVDRKKGILRWDVPVAAQASGLKAQAIEYKFKLEYDKGYTLSGVAAAMK